MSQPPPPKPKPGSLRDRIAAFEKPSAAPAPGPAPAPRPKPGGISWKPKPASPPSSPGPPSPSQGSSQETKTGGGMSASDAKESIGKGGSLKERMAALQGKGAFGAPPPIAPKPNLEKPKWKPPPVIARPIDDEEEEPRSDERIHSPPLPAAAPTEYPVAKADASADEEPPSVAEGEEQPEADPQEEERQRRAAIAARMARLGGARLGMTPPVFGKPTVKKVDTPKEEAPKGQASDEAEVNSEDASAVDKKDLTLPDVQSTGSKPAESDYFPAKKESDSASLHSVDSPSLPARTPNSMPVPAGPRRAGPPRKKPAKSPSPLPTPEILGGEITESPEVVPALVPQANKSDSALEKDSEQKAREGDREEEVGEVSKDVGHEVDTSVSLEAKEPVLQKKNAEVEEPKPQFDTPSADQSPEHDVDQPDTATGADEDNTVVAHDFVESQSTPEQKPSLHEPPVSQSEETRETVEESVDAKYSNEEDAARPEEAAAKPEEAAAEPEPSVQEVDEEEEEIARRKRVAERLAKMGGVNPFAPPPQRKASASSVDTPASPLVPKFAGPGSESVNPPRPPERKVSLARKSSVDSTTTGPPSTNVEHESPAQPPPLQRIESLELTGDNDVADPAIKGKSSQDDRPHDAIPGHRRTFSTLGLEESAKDEDRLEAPSEHDYDDALEPAPPQGSERIDIPGSDDEQVDELGHGDIPSSVSLEDVDVAKTQPLSPSRAPPPVPSATTRPQVVPYAQNPEELILEDAVAPQLSTSDLQLSDEDVPQQDVSSPRRSLPPPPRVVPDLTEDEDEASEQEHIPVLLPHQPSPETLDLSPSRKDQEAVASELESPLRRLPPPAIPQSAKDETDDIHPAPLRHPSRRSMPPPPRSLPEVPTDNSATSSTVELLTSPRRMVPSPPVTQTNMIEEHPDDTQPDHDPEAEEEALPTPPPPPRRATRPTSLRQHESRPARFPGDESHRVVSPGRAIPPVPHAQFRRPTNPTSPNDLLVPPATPASEQEVLDESEGDPIDPAFHSPSHKYTNLDSSSGKSSDVDLRQAAASATPPQSASETEDVEQTRRQTIADRMAKLGGIKFGAAPLPFARPVAPPSFAEDTISNQLGTAEGEPTAEAELTEEEEEQARKQRIAAKLAGMGGMRFGMLPSQPSKPQKQSSADPGESSVVPPTQRATPPARPPPPMVQSAETDSELESSVTSDDGVKVEAEESELEEIHHGDAEDNEPPPIPTRVGRHSSMQAEPPRKLSQSTSQSGRPAVPNIPPSKRSSTLTTTERRASVDSNIVQHQRGSSSHRLVVQPQSEYVMVDEPDACDSDILLAPPPRPASRPPPARGAPPPPPPPPSAIEWTEGATSQWELPTIPSSSIELGVSDDLPTPTWSDDSTTYPTPSLEPPQTPAKPVHRQSQMPAPQASKSAPESAQLSSDDLMAVWGRVGVQICEVATTLHEKSKKSLIGDGSYLGFIGAVLGEVPNAALPAPPSYGHLVYAQVGTAVQRRASEILPGDIAVLHDAKFKGHKGIHTYNQTVGADEALVGIVSEFEAKKSKIRLFQANQHVGQQTVESASYRLEDLKSGEVKIFRVLEA